MIKRITNFFTKNIGLKILSLFFAVLAWLLIVNTDDPTQSKSFTVNVKATHTDAVTEDMGLLYEVDGGIVSVSFTVSAKRSIMEKLTASDFKATADFKNIVVSEDNSYGTVPIDVTCSRYSNQVTVTRPSKQYKVLLDESVESSIPVEVITTGDPADGCLVGEVSATPNLLNISGPSGVLASVSKAVATINVSGQESDVSVTTKLIFCDEDGNEVPNSDRITSTVKSVTAYAKMLDYKPVNVVVEYSGAPADGYDVTGFDVDTTSVEIKGKRDVLKNVNSIKIPATIINVDEKTTDTDFEIDIRSFLPDGVSLVDGDDSKINVKVKISPIVQNMLTVPVNQIRVIGLTSDCELDFTQSDIIVIVEGTQDKTSKVRASDLDISLNVTGLGTGAHTTNVTCRGASGFKVTTDQVSYEIVKIDSESTPDDTGTGIPGEEVTDNPDDTGNDDNSGSGINISTGDDNDPDDPDDIDDIDDSGEDVNSSSEKNDSADESVDKS